MSNIIKFPTSEEAKKRFVAIEVENEDARLEREMQEIHAKVDREIAHKYGSLEGYGRHLIDYALWGANA